MRENNSLKKSKPWAVAFALSGLVSLAIWSRVLPHPSNMTAMVPAAVLAGYFLSNLWLATLVPMAALALTDAFFFGFYPGIEYVYGAALVSMLVGRWVKGKKLPFIVVGGLSSSVLFFLISNFGVWMSTALYAKTWDGLVQCYVMALPFFRNQIVGDVVYGALLLGAIQLLLLYVRNTNEAQADS